MSNDTQFGLDDQMLSDEGVSESGSEGNEWEEDTDGENPLGDNNEEEDEEETM